MAVQVAWAKSTSGATLALGPKSTTVAVRVAVQVALLGVNGSCILKQVEKDREHIDGTRL